MSLIIPDNLKQQKETAHKLKAITEFIGLNRKWWEPIWLFRRRLSKAYRRIYG